MKEPYMVLFVCVIVVLAIWDAVWKLIAMWKSARNNQLAWFVCLAIFNTVGILPILYITLFQKPQPPAAAALYGTYGTRPG
jgi:predicted membrane channel-forming protein YqfA (hemolysin III family)